MDILHQGDVVALIGNAWYGPETEANSAFRWISNDARFNVSQLTRAAYRLVIEIEPGPGVGLKPFDLVITEGENILKTSNLKGRETLHLDLGAGEPRVRELALRVTNAADSVIVPGERRSLKMRVFKIALERGGVDVVSVDQGLKVGAGWYALEEFKGQIFRWGGSEAVIEAQFGAKVDSFALDIEPGPGVGAGPLKFKVFAGDQEQGKFEVTTRERIEIPWPTTAGSTLRLRVESGGKSIASDPRVMNFRAFATNE